MRVSSNLSIRRIANLFGAIGYSLLVFAYVIVLTGTVLWLIQSGFLSVLGIHYQPPAQQLEATQAVSQPRQVPVLLQIISLSMTAVMALTIIFVAITLPYWLARSGSYLLKRCIRLCQCSVTLRTLLYAKLLACLLAVVPVLVAGVYDYHALPVAMTELGFLVTAAVVFLLQHHLAETNKTVAAKEIW